SQTVQAAIREARAMLKEDPDGALELLRANLLRVRDHPDLGDRVRDGLLSLLQKELRDTSISGKNIKLAKEERLRVINQVKVESEREQQLRTAYERIEAQFQVFKSLMGVARIEEKTKQEVIQGMLAMDAEARLKGGPGVPQATQVLYRQALVNYHIRKNL